LILFARFSGVGAELLQGGAVKAAPLLSSLAGVDMNVNDVNIGAPQTERPMHPTPPPIDRRLQIAALWVSVLLIFAYVDLFSLYRADFLTGLAAEQIAGMQVDQTFLSATTLYIILPSLMIPLTLFLPRRANKWGNVAMALLYAASIVAACIGETWIYYLLGSAVEVILLLIVTRLALKL